MKYNLNGVISIKKKFTVKFEKGIYIVKVKKVKVKIRVWVFSKFVENLI